MDRRHLLTLGLIAAARPLTVHAQGADAQKTLRLIVPTPAGGASDTCARLVSAALGRVLNQKVVVENKPGAGGALAAHALLAAAPDGQTLLWTLASMSGLPVLQKSSPYRALNELTPISLVGRFTYALFASPGLGLQDTAALVARLRAQPGQLNYGTGSLGDWMATTHFLKAVGGAAQRVPYQGGSQVMPDLAAGRLHFNFGPLSSGLGLVREGRVQALAVLQAERSALAPQVPTLAETGVAGIHYAPWQGLYAPPGLPAAAAAQLGQAVAEVLAEPALRTGLQQQALQTEAGLPPAMAAAAERDAQAWQQFAAEFRIAPE